MHSSIHNSIGKKGRSGCQDGLALRQSGAVVVRTLDLHGEAAAGVQRAAAVRMTARAATEIFMVPEAEAVGDACVVSGSSAEVFCSSGRPFIGSQGSRGSAPPQVLGSFHKRTLSAVTK